MVWPRYIAYFVGITLLTWMLTRLEISFPGSLELHVIAYPGDQSGTSEFSPIEFIQPLILGVCGMLMAWVANYCPSQRPIAIPFGGIALAFLISELSYFLDYYLITNIDLVLIGIVSALVIVYTHRARKRLRIAWGRVWPSPALALIFAGAVLSFSYVRLVSQESLWMSILGDDYQPVVQFAVEEFTELIAYLLWLLGTIEYTYQARAIAYREPQHAAQRLRQKRRHDQEGQY
jgi:cytochrome c oxidase subunit IV